jgi:hypothetical protein
MRWRSVESGIVEKQNGEIRLNNSFDDRDFHLDWKENTLWDRWKSQVWSHFNVIMCHYLRPLIKFLELLATSSRKTERE